VVFSSGGGPRRDDEYNTVVWEAVAFTLAQQAGIRVPAVRIETVGKQLVLLLRRFDREGPQRIPFLSAMSMRPQQNGVPASLNLGYASRR
jgi:serine/threonine-protein kinase HipA